ncbi:hypothetical protein IOD13_07165 [Brevibacterium casei]|nr:hypothetical protein [Brevibacterium casei]
MIAASPTSTSSAPRPPSGTSSPTHPRTCASSPIPTSRRAPSGRGARGRPRRARDAPRDLPLPRRRLEHRARRRPRPPRRASGARARFGYRLLLDFAVPESHVEALGRSGIAITLDPSLDQPLAALSAGAQVSLVLAEDSPWAGVRSAVLGTHGIGARAAFNAATRFAHRAAGNPEGECWVPVPPHFGRWRVERLVVQVADPRVAAWSTDPRSGTPGLPELAADVPSPPGSAERDRT